eukprot:TRINITY_DN7092_c4_g1_i1.p1 TRINITY_DN7092_c4_g1~~TRINITY_DN7092_c4_g1_i1.p1  ORF type:complete len:535 (+),score=77.36 TRINITY_DN7092_c4_g1_i1:58-1662(+)
MSASSARRVARCILVLMPAVVHLLRSPQRSSMLGSKIVCGKTLPLHGSRRSIQAGGSIAFSYATGFRTISAAAMGSVRGVSQKNAMLNSKSWGRQSDSLSRTFTTLRALREITLPSEVATSDKIYLLLCTHGLEKEAQILVSRTLADSGRELRFASLPAPDALTADDSGHAAVGKLLLGLNGSSLSPEEVAELPGIIHSYAFVAAAAGVPKEKETALSLLTSFVSELPAHLSRALQLTAFASDSKGVKELIPRFRASVVRDGKHEFTSEQAMVAVGTGAVEAVPWMVDMTRYDVELVGVMHGDVLALGLSCARLGEERKGATRPSKLPQETRPWQLSEHRHMRFSTATLMLEFANVSPGEKLLDFCGGVGTIALEAATRIPNLKAISSDMSKRSCKTAQDNVDACFDLSLFATGSSINVFRKKVEDWNSSESAEKTFDVVVTELPFGASMKVIEPKVVVESLAKLLTPNLGRAALITPRSLRSFAADTDYTTFFSSLLTSDDGMWKSCSIRNGNVGGIPVHMVLLHRGPGASVA